MLSPEKRSVLEAGLRLSHPGLLLVAELGAGAQGAVYHGYDPAANVHTAVKAFVAHDDRTHARLERELRAVRAVNHPGVITITTGPHTADDLSYYTMPYFPLGSLDKVPYRDDPVRARRFFGYAFDLFTSICRAVQAIHDARHIHRDLKPRNILFGASSFDIVVADLGIVIPFSSTHTLTDTADRVGPWLYGAPETMSGVHKASPSPATDVYSLGKILYFLLTGNDPEHGALPTDTLFHREYHLQAVGDLLVRATATDPARRIQTVTDLMERIDTIQENLVATTYFGFKQETPPHELVIHEQPSTRAQRLALSTRFGRTKEDVIIKPEATLQLKIRRTAGAQGVADLSYEETVVYLRPGSYETTVSVTTLDENVADPGSSFTPRNLEVRSKQVRGRTATFRVEYTKRIAPHVAYTFGWSFRDGKVYGPEHD